MTAQNETTPAYTLIDDLAVDLALDPNNPRRLYAAIWEVVRRPWTLVSGGQGSAALGP